jgi:anti-anti-sigma factor
MAEPQATQVSCPVVVLRIETAQVSGDTVAEALRDEFLTIYSRSRAQNAVLDLRPVMYLSSAGFRPLLSLLRAVHGRGGRLVLFGLRPSVEETFTTTRLISTRGSGPSTFELQPDLAAAVASLDASVPQAPASV